MEAFSEYDCCDERIAKQPKCFNIDVNGDVFYAAINRTCMDFSRSDFHCLQNNPWFDQFNDATSFLDCSQVYGSTKSLQMALRQHKDGLLATNQRLKDFLPTRLDLGKALDSLTFVPFHVLLTPFTSLKLAIKFVSFRPLLTTKRSKHSV